MIRTQDRVWPKRCNTYKPDSCIVANKWLFRDWDGAKSDYRIYVIQFNSNLSSNGLFVRLFGNYFQIILKNLRICNLYIHIKYKLIWSDGSTVG